MLRAILHHAGPRRPGEPIHRFAGRHVAVAMALYGTLVVTAFLLALAAAYAFPWLLDPVAP